MKTPPLSESFNGYRSVCLFCGTALLSLLTAGVAWGRSTGAEKPLMSYTGYVFVNGEYVPPPYVIKDNDLESTVEINGRTIELAIPARPGPQLKETHLVAVQLDVDGILVAEGGKEVSFLCHETQIQQFLKHLLGMMSRDQAVHYASYPPVTASQRVKSTRFSPTPELVNRARRTIARIDASNAEDAAAETGLERLSMFAFPLTVAGMILAVLASGHLITYPPRPIEFEPNARVRESSERATVICLALLVALSGLDLAWTLLASQAGQMIELNPVGSRMVDDPSSLIAFKVSLTLASGGILFAFRRRHSARVASWWLCMTLTLLTFRWLVFNSMHAA